MDQIDIVLFVWRKRYRHRAALKISKCKFKSLMTKTVVIVARKTPCVGMRKKP